MSGEEEMIPKNTGKSERYNPAGAEWQICDHRNNSFQLARYLFQAIKR
jgi:hypothetical protein